MKLKRKTQQIPIIFRPMLQGEDVTSDIKNRAKYHILIGGICSFLFILGFVGASTIYLSNFIKNSIIVEGVVQAVEPMTSDYRKEVTYVFELFTDTGHELVEGTDIIKYGSRDIISINDPIMIIYSANDPSRNILYNTLNPVRHAPFILGGMAFFTALGLYLFFFGLTVRRLTNHPKIKNDTANSL